MRSLLAKAFILLAVVTGIGAAANAPASADVPTSSSHTTATDWHW